MSAAIQAGSSHRIVQRWLGGGADFEVILCPTVIAEVADVLTQRPRMRKWIDLDVGERYVEMLRALADIVPDPEVVGATTRDVDDDYLVALARDHAVDYIVTGDKDLLEWLDQRPPVITPAAAEKLLAG